MANLQTDIVVIGGGHAGCEAAAAATRVGCEVAMVTLRADRIAQMSCNPAVGGVGKGHLVREIDALGGLMARVADETGVHFRRLNASRGPAVRSTRCQSDSAAYRDRMGEVVRDLPGLTIVEGEVVSLAISNGILQGVNLRDGETIGCRAVVVTSGTFLNGVCHVGSETFAGGRVNDKPALGLSDALRAAGLRLGRFKTGTTPRLRRDSIAWDQLEEQKGEIPRPCFSFDKVVGKLPEVSCAITYTNARTHQVVQDNLEKSPLFRGIIEGTGPRYCPSLEDKVVRFQDRNRHQIFLEPEGVTSDRVYPNGLSTSLPKEAQVAFIQSIEGLERAEIVQPGYAVEYDYIPPTQLEPSLMTKSQAGLFTGGQVNGTSGYEEAGAQGLMAGLNAARWVKGLGPAVLGRDQAYIGVMIDDLVTKGVDEPYRVFTSRAEHRLSLRESNAEERLFSVADAWGLLNEARRSRAQQRIEAAAALRARVAGTRVGRDVLHGDDLPEGLLGLGFEDAARRPDVSLARLLGESSTSTVVQLVEEEIKYAGYIAREHKAMAQMRKLESIKIPAAFDYAGTPGLSHEAIEKLTTVRPQTLGQAARVPGVTPAAVALLRIRADKVRSSV